jgi:cation diffusion facilitator CzcD-associated flavoprotein CzcO
MFGSFVEPVLGIGLRRPRHRSHRVHEVDVAIIGGGPYGLSLAAHLKDLGVEHQVFGTPMSFWRNSMPPGMELKSEGSSCDLFDWRREFGIEEFYREISRPFVGRVIVPAELFLAYGLGFQKKFVPDLDVRNVANVSRSDGRFILRLQDGSALRAARVVVATGIRDYAYIPEALRGLPKDFVTHSAEYGSLDHLSGRKVLVIGGGASAVDLAWSLFQRGATSRWYAGSLRSIFTRSLRRANGIRRSARQTPQSAVDGSCSFIHTRRTFFAFYRKRRAVGL